MKTRHLITLALALTLPTTALAEWGSGGAGGWGGGGFGGIGGWSPDDLDGDGFDADEDCNDFNQWVHPGADERCDGVDNDCDGTVDEGVIGPYYYDGDGDGVGAGAPIEACFAPLGTVLQNGDCDDGDADIHPGAAELCDFADNDCDGDTDEDFVPEGLGDPRVEATFFGQTHLLQTDDPYFGLVGGRDVLIKAHVLATTARDDVSKVKAILRLGDARKVLLLSGPDRVPDVACVAPGQGGHRLDDAFVGTIPADWVAPGLRVKIKVERASGQGGNQVWYFPEVGAPTALQMNMFDVRYFSADEETYPAGWREELAQRLPVASLDVQRIPADFPVLVVPPRPDVDVVPPCECPEDDAYCVPAAPGEPCDAENIKEGLPGYRVDSQASYAAQSGFPFDGEQGAALQWSDALAEAGGQRRLSLTWVNIHGVWAGGQAGGFDGVSAVHAGILIHEVGHALGLGHLVDHGDYPYRGDAHGIPGPGDTGHRVGPQWGLDLRPEANGGQPYFIPPTVQASSPAAGEWLGHWKRSPMQRVGDVGDDYEAGFLYQMFSDWGADRMRGWLANHVAVYAPALDDYATYDAATGDYTAALPAGVARPIANHVPVVSVMAAASLVTPDLNMVYPPVGPYQGGLIRRFDPRVAADRTAASAYCGGGCDLTVRITQGGATRVFMLDGALRDDLPETAVASLSTRAINLPAADGAVTAIELYHTPDVEQSGLPGSFPAGHSAIATWTAN